MRSTAPDNADAMPGAVRSGESLGDGASSDGVGLFVAVFVLAGVVERVLVAAEVLVADSRAVFVVAGVLVSVATGVGRGRSDSSARSGGRSFVAFFVGRLTRRGLRPVGLLVVGGAGLLALGLLALGRGRVVLLVLGLLVLGLRSVLVALVLGRSDLPSDRSDLPSELSDLPPDDFSDPLPPPDEPLSFPATAATRSPTTFAGAVLARAVAASSAAARRKPHSRAASTRTRRVAQRSRARHVPSMPVTPLRRRSHLVECRIAADHARQSLSAVEIDKLLRTDSSMSFQGGGTTTKRTP